MYYINLSADSAVNISVGALVRQIDSNYSLNNFPLIIDFKGQNTGSLIQILVFPFNGIIFYYVRPLSLCNVTMHFSYRERFQLLGLKKCLIRQKLVCPRGTVCSDFSLTQNSGRCYETNFPQISFKCNSFFESLNRKPFGMLRFLIWR